MLMIGIRQFFTRQNFPNPEFVKIFHRQNFAPYGIRIRYNHTRMVQKIIPYAYGTYRTRTVCTIRVWYEIRIRYTTQLRITIYGGHDYCYYHYLGYSSSYTLRIRRRYLFWSGHIRIIGPYAYAGNIKSHDYNCILLLLCVWASHIIHLSIHA